MIRRPDRLLAIAHRSGNTVAGLRQALDARVDLVEADVHPYRGVLEVRHHKNLGTRHLWDKWELVPRADFVRGDRLSALYVLALTTGMRQGELLALHWANLDLPGRRLAIRGSLHRDPGGGWTIREPKTERSRRQVVLPPMAVKAPQGHRLRQNAERLHGGPLWEENDLVFPNHVGRPLSSQNLVQRHFHPLLERLSLPKIRFHDLRHTAATLLLAEGVHPKIVSEMLGHTEIGHHSEPLLPRHAGHARVRDVGTRPIVGSTRWW